MKKNNNNIILMKIIGTFDGLAFTPYLAVHHAISHKFAHDMEAQRYPVIKKD